MLCGEKKRFASPVGHFAVEREGERGVPRSEGRHLGRTDVRLEVPREIRLSDRIIARDLRPKPTTAHEARREKREHEKTEHPSA